MSRRYWSLLVAVLALIGAGCSGAPRTLESTGLIGQKNTDVTVWVGPIATLHPHHTSAHVAMALFAPLVSSNPVTRLPQWGEDAPGALLASIQSTDLQRWRLTLKTGRRWHDGTKLTAQDLVRGWEAAIEENLPLLSTVVEVRAVDATTMAVALTAPFGQFPQLLTHQTFLPLHLMAQTDPEGYASDPIGSGPYQVSSRAADALVLTRVAAVPQTSDQSLERIHLQLGANPAAQTDVAVGSDGGPPPETTQAVRGATVQRFAGRQLAYLGIPLSEDRFSDLAVREALSLAVDVNQIVSQLMGEEVMVADRLLGPGFARGGGVSCEACGYDPQRARSLWPDDFDAPLTIWFAVDAGHENLIDAVAAAWQDVLDVSDIQLATQPADQLLDRLAKHEVSGPFRLTWQADLAAPVRLIQPLFGPSGQANDVGLQSPAVADLLGQAGRSREVAGSLDVYAAAEQAVLDQVPIIPLWFSTVAVITTDRVFGVVLDGEGRLDWAQLRT